MPSLATNQNARTRFEARGRVNKRWRKRSHSFLSGLHLGPPRALRGSNLPASRGRHRSFLRHRNHILLSSLCLHFCPSRSLSSRDPRLSRRRKPPTSTVTACVRRAKRRECRGNCLKLIGQSISFFLQQPDNISHVRHFSPREIVAAWCEPVVRFLNP